MQLELLSPWGDIESPSADEIAEYGQIKYPLKLGQKIAIEQILQWLNDPYEEEYLLRGFAGTGKTTIVQLICAYLRCEAPHIKIGQCAYSHHAKKVLLKTSKEAGLSIPAMTCCQMLEARPYIDESTGVVEFVSGNGANQKIRSFNLVIVDEAFSLDSKDLGKFRRAIAGTDIKILYLGDSAQTGPIGELHSPVEEIRGYELTEVVRYGGYILDYATTLRSNLRILHDLPESAFCEQQLTGLWNMDRLRWDKIVRSAFKNFYDIDPYARRVLCFTNKRVAQMNAIIRESIYGERKQLGQFMVNERISFKDPYEGDCQGFHTSDEAIVLSWKEDSIREGGADLDIFRVSIDHEGSIGEIPVIQLSSMPKFNKILDKLGQTGSWHLYHELRSKFAWVDYPYTLTTHRGKGSTFADVFVDTCDMRTCLYHKVEGDPHGHIIQFNRLMYTAATRPTNRLFLGV